MYSLEEKVDKIFTHLYDLQVNQDLDRTKLPRFDDLCFQLFGDLSDNYKSILVNCEAFNEFVMIHNKKYQLNLNISLKPKAIEMIEEHGSYLKYLLHTKKSSNSIVNNSFNAPINLNGEKVYFMSNVEIKHDEKVINSLNQMIENLKHNQDMELVFKGKLIDSYTELLETIIISKESKLSITDNLISLATNLLTLGSSFGS